MLVLHDKSAACIPAPADSPWIHGHKYNLTNFRACPFPRKATDPSSETLVDLASVFILRPDKATEPQDTHRESL